MSTAKKDSNLMKIVGIVAAAFILIGLCVFLFSNDGGISGAATLGQEGGSFWFSTILFSILAIAVIVAGVFRFRKTQKPANIIVALIVAVVFIAIAWGKACTDKANNGVTTEQGRPAK